MWNIGNTLTIDLLSCKLAMELSLVSGEHNIEILVHGNLVINIVHFVSEDSHLVKDMAEEGIYHDEGAPLVAEGTLPSLVL